MIADLNGKKYAWQGVALLPFVDEKRLLKTLKSVSISKTLFPFRDLRGFMESEEECASLQVYPDLSEEELLRNSTGPDRLFIGSRHPAYAFLKEIYDESQDKSEFFFFRSFVLNCL